MGTLARFLAAKQIDTPKDNYWADAEGDVENVNGGVKMKEVAGSGRVYALNGGVNVLFMDGSVKFVKESIALSVWRGLSTRNGGEIVSGSDY